MIQRVMAKLKASLTGTSLLEVIGPDVVLVPAPRSAPLRPGALWPAKRIADEMVSAGLGRKVETCLQRSTNVQKSAFSPPGGRPSVLEHYQSMQVTPTLSSPARITVVDDVVTKGATLLAACALIQKAFPTAEVKGFALIRTLGLQPDVAELIAPCTGTILLNQWGEANRVP